MPRDFTVGFECFCGVFPFLFSAWLAAGVLSPTFGVAPPPKKALLLGMRPLPP